MEAYRRLEDLTLMDDYMFGTVMQDPKLIRPLIERILDMRIRQVTYIEPQRTMKSGFDAKGIRLDLYVEDENGIVYNVEVQTTRHRSLPKRMRYYQSAVDINVLSPGADYARLRKSCYSSASSDIVGFAGLPPRKLDKHLPCFLLQRIHQNGRQPLFLFPVPCSLFPRLVHAEL